MNVDFQLFFTKPFAITFSNFAFERYPPKVTVKYYVEINLIAI